MKLSRVFLYFWYMARTKNPEQWIIRFTQAVKSRDVQTARACLAITDVDYDIDRARAEAKDHELLYEILTHEKQHRAFSCPTLDRLVKLIDCEFEDVVRQLLKPVHPLKIRQLKDEIIELISEEDAKPAHLSVLRLL